MRDSSATMTSSGTGVGGVGVGGGVQGATAALAQMAEVESIYSDGTDAMPGTAI